MKSVEKTAKTVTEAVEAALSELEVTIDQVDYKIIDVGSKGFLGFGAKPARVVVNIKDSEDDVYENIKDEVKKEIKPEIKKEVEKEIKPEIKKEVEKEIKDEIKREIIETSQNLNKQGNKEEITDNEQVVVSKRDSINDDEIISTAEKFLTDIFNAIKIKAEFDSKLIDKKMLTINIIGDNMGIIIGKRGQTLDSLQYLVNLVVNKGDNAYISVSIDTENYREKRKETLENLAVNLAKKAKHNKRNVVLEPMNPYERRIIHSTLQNDKFVTTFSEGEEPFRYVTIALKSNVNFKK